MITRFELIRLAFRVLVAALCLTVAKETVKVSSQIFMVFDAVDQCNPSLPFPVNTSMYANTISISSGSVDCQMVNGSLTVFFPILFVTVASATWVAFQGFYPEEPISESEKE